MEVVPLVDGRRLGSSTKATTLPAGTGRTEDRPARGFLSADKEKSGMGIDIIAERRRPPRARRVVTAMLLALALMAFSGAGSFAGETAPGLPEECITKTVTVDHEGEVKVNKTVNTFLGVNAAIDTAVGTTVKKHVVIELCVAVDVGVSAIVEVHPDALGKCPEGQTGVVVGLTLTSSATTGGSVSVILRVWATDDDSVTVGQLQVADHQEVHDELVKTIFIPANTIDERDSVSEKVCIAVE